MYANTDSRTLASWNILVNFDSSVLQYVRTDDASPYSITTGTSTPGVLNMLGSVPIDTANELITSSNIHLGDLVFNVLSSSAASSDLSGNVVQLTTKSSYVFVSSQSCRVNDHVGSSDIKGSILIRTNSLVDIMSSCGSSDEEIVNLAQLDGLRREFSVSTIGVYERQGEAEITSGRTCTSSDLNVLQVML
jgi:hypothetical protein